MTIGTRSSLHDGAFKGDTYPAGEDDSLPQYVVSHNHDPARLDHRLASQHGITKGGPALHCSPAFTAPSTFQARRVGSANLTSKPNSRDRERATPSSSVLQAGQQCKQKSQKELVLKSADPESQGDIEYKKEKISGRMLYSSAHVDHTVKLPNDALSE